MNDYKWYNDDFQNNSSNNNTSYEANYTYTQTEAPRKKSRMKKFFADKKKIGVTAVSVALVAVITVSGYALFSGNSSPELSDTLQNNLGSNIRERCTISTE